jgi:hypothetical protein
MYWTKYLVDAPEASAMDWQAIGGTWGSATSKLLAWIPTERLESSILSRAVSDIAATGQTNSVLMSRYVHKYFHDVATHFRNLKSHLSPDAKLNYIIGNSSFFGVLVDSPQIYMQLLHSYGYKDVASKALRKRNSSKALFEYCVTASL